jgi:hypothetical protein
MPPASCSSPPPLPSVLSVCSSRMEPASRLTHRAPVRDAQQRPVTLYERRAAVRAGDKPRMSHRDGSSCDGADVNDVVNRASDVNDLVNRATLDMQNADARRVCSAHDGTGDGRVWELWFQRV